MNLHSVTNATTSPHTANPPADKREAILAAALELFAERTFEGTPVPLIAQRAGVAAGTIYRYFDNKEALVNALFQRWKHELRRVLADAIASGGSHEERFRLLWRGLWRFAADEPLALAFLETHHHDAYLDAASRALARSIDASAATYVTDAQDAGAMRRASAAMLIALVFGAFAGIVRQAGPHGLSFDEAAVRASADVMWSALRAQGTQSESVHRKESR